MPAQYVSGGPERSKGEMPAQYVSGAAHSSQFVDVVVVVYVVADAVVFVCLGCREAASGHG